MWITLIYELKPLNISDYLSTQKFWIVNVTNKEHFNTYIELARYLFSHMHSLIDFRCVMCFNVYVFLVLTKLQRTTYCQSCNKFKWD